MFVVLISLIIMMMTTEVAAQGQALPVRAVQNCIYGLSVPLYYRVFGYAPEYVDHLLSSCTPTSYKQRHNKVVSIVHWRILQ